MRASPAWILCGLIVSGLVVRGTAPVANAKPKRPNILCIITDDHRSDSLACYNRATTGKPDSELGYVESPNVDRLASESLLVEQSRLSRQSSSYTHPVWSRS